jgi:starch-binding outer membrane protein, SusD/RagB family
MKKIFLGILSLLAVATIISSCQKIDVAVTSEITPDSYPKTDAQFISAEGPVYNALRADFAVSYWFTQSCSTDEAVLPTFGPNWYDGNKYAELHLHTWTKDNAWVNASWSYLTNIIGTANQAISTIRSTAPAGTSKNTGLAELKTMRALAFYMMMDMYGNVPLDTLFGVKAS